MSGCAQSNPLAERNGVSGTVKLDGAPLAEGTIAFDRGDGAVPGSAEIKNGSYNLTARPGLNKVVIRSFKVDPSIVSKDPARPVDNRVNLIPEKYNDKTTLTADVTADKKKFDFDLTSK
ncbi:MAG: hypothetical protein U0744_12180 [Gemmataceae bacterium]